MTTENKYVLAIDQGTTSSRTILFNHAGQNVASGQLEHAQIFPHAGWVEHDPVEIWNNVRQTVGLALANGQANKDDIVAVGVTNQRETTIIWDRKTGEPVYNAIVWQDTRSQDLVDRLAADGGPDRFRPIVGETLSTYASITKIMWILENVEGVRERAERGELAFGNPDTWVIWQMTGGVEGGVHVTDVTNASRTMLMDLETLQWREDICEIAGIPMSLLPEIKSSSEVYGVGRPAGLLYDVPIAGDLGDQQAATFGQACFTPGMAKNTYGTGCFMLMNTGEKRVPSQNGLLTTIAWGIDGKVEYALEGSIFVAGAAVQWLRDELRLIDHAAESEPLARSVPDSNGVYVVPAFVGLGAPYWDMYARGTIVGLTRGVNKNHIIRATLDSLCYQINDVLAAMQADSGIDLTALKVDGGACANNYLLQTMADISNLPVKRPCCVETTALGAAYLAGLAVGYWSSTEDVLQNWSVDREFMPGIPDDERTRRLKGWNKAVRCSYGWAKEE